MKCRLSTFIGVIMSFIIAVPTYGDMTSEEAGAYVEEIVDYISKNYVGSDVPVDALVRAAISGMTDVLDNYSQYYTREQYDDIMKNVAKIIYKPCFDVKLNEEGMWEIENLDLKADPGLSGLRNGDEIIKVNDVDVRGFSQAEINSVLSSFKSTKINIVVKRGNRSRDAQLVPVTVKTVEIEDLAQLLNIQSEKLNKYSGYVKISTIGEGTSKEFNTALNTLKKNNVKKLILDLRGNTGGYTDQAIEICKQIIPSGIIISTKDKAGIRQSYHSDLKNPPFEKIVVLVDDMTASASEIIASAVQDSGIGIVVGKATFGKGVMQTVVEFEDMGILKITSHEYYTRNGKKLNGVGIKPDVSVNEIPYLKKEHTLESPEVAQVLDFLGYNVSSQKEIKRSIGRFQNNKNLPTTYKLDEATISAINVDIYTSVLKTDRTLFVGYLNL